MPKEKKLVPSNKRIIIAVLVLALLILLFIFLPKLINLVKTEDTQTQEQEEIISSDKVTLWIQSDKKTYETGETILSKVYVNTAGKAINAVGFEIDFPTDLAQVERVDTTESFCTLFPENTFDNETGQITYSCGLPTPGLTDEKGLVGVFYLKARNAGTCELKLNDYAQVLANDGLGTDILEETSGVTLDIVEKD